MMRLAPLATVLLLAACSGAPKKSSPPADATHAPPGKAAARAARRSPYPPAQEDPRKRGDYVAGGLYAPHIRDSAPDYIPDVDAIPEPEVVDEPRSAYGNRSPYQVLGRSYRVLDRTDGFVERGLASYYGNKFHGRRTSNLEVYDMYAFTAAHKSLPLPSFARVTNLENGRSVVVRVNDRGPFHEGRVVDLSWAAAVKLDMHRAGTAQVEVRALSPGENARHAPAAVAARTPAAASPTASPAASAPAATAIDRLVEALPIAAAGAGERPAAVAPAAPAAPAASPATAEELRFNMMQDGRVMTADDFDAWLQANGVSLSPGERAGPAPSAAAPATPPPSTLAAAAVPQTPPPAASVGSVTLQIAAFGARANAEQALSRLRGAGIAGARLIDGVAGGKPVWRLRVGPVDAAMVPELSARFAGLGFGQPHIVRE